MLESKEFLKRRAFPIGVSKKMPNENIEFDATTQSHLDQWLNGSYDEKTKNEVQRLIKENPKEILDAFYETLSFGTGGLRGIIGVGCNRINIYTVQFATQGLANYINRQLGNEEEKRVFIGYDCRRFSKDFAQEAARVLAGNGISVFLFKALRPTPLVSFGCRLKKCTAAIMITASHNPPNYNGYKVYWDDGAQVLPPHDVGIIQEVNKISNVENVKKASLDDQKIHWVQEEIDEAYLKSISSLQHFPRLIKQKGKNLKVVYTSLHGTGGEILPKALSHWGFTQQFFVEEQMIPDGDFPTVSSPNPEEESALRKGLEKLEQVQGDILIATDPDADRMGVAVLHKGKPVILDGNQIACILLEHVCQSLATLGKLPENAAFVKTIVTTDLFEVIVNAYERTCFNVLTGFKYIAEKIRIWEHDQNSSEFVFGAEESYGYLYGTHVRDKDAIISSLLICEAAFMAKQGGKTLLDRLYDLYRKYGVYRDKLLSLKFAEGKEGKQSMLFAMEKLRNSPPKHFCDIPIVCIEDYLVREKKDCASNKKEPITLPKSDVLLFRLEDGSKIVIRPSGTEPKMKIYCSVLKKSDKIEEAMIFCDQLAEKFLNSLSSLLYS